LLGVAGCGKPGGVVVEGTVSCNGAPADSGSVTFNPADGKGPSVGAPITDGKYRFDAKAGLTPGKKQVDISAIVKTGKKIPAGPPAPAGQMIDDIQHFTAKETVEVTASQNSPHDFALKGLKKPR
jgi:hypothetical protein